MDKTISGITGNFEIKMCKYLHFNILIFIALLVSCNNPSDLSLEKNGQYYFRGYPIISLQESTEISN